MSKKQVRVIPAKSCFFWHRWKLAKETPIYQYSECKDCGARKVETTHEGYCPIDENWLFGKIGERP